MTIATDVDTVCTEAELDEFLGGRLEALRPKGWTSCKPARVDALRRIVEHLARLSPPIYEAALQDVTEMKRGIMYGAAEHLYRLSVTRGSDGEVYFEMMKRYGDMFESEMENFRPLVNTLSANTLDPLRATRANANKIRVVRR